MIDYHVQTFLDLYQTKNYTKTAQNMNMSQPAVSQHIRYLEQKLDVTLFHYDRKVLHATREGDYLYRHALSLYVNAQHVKEELHELSRQRRMLRIGATKTIGEYLLPAIITALYKKLDHTDLEIEVENTEVLLDKIRDGALEMACIEGLFNKQEFHTCLLKREEMVAVVGKEHPLARMKDAGLEELFAYPLLVREEGSGSREVLVQALASRNSSLKDFKSLIKINHIAAIKQLLKNGIGVSFLYQSAVSKEIEEGSLIEIRCRGISLMREFNMICMKDSLHESEFDRAFAFFIQALEN